MMCPHHCILSVLQGWAPLHSAVSAGRDIIVEILLSLGADTTLQTSGGQTALHYAVSAEYDSIPLLIARLPVDSLSLNVWGRGNEGRGIFRRNRHAAQQSL